MWMVVASGRTCLTDHARPTVDATYAMLRRRGALMVHFSGTPKGAGSTYTHLYPLDLQEVIRDGCHGGLSCSTVMPGDEFTDLKNANATGCVGVILGLKSGGSIKDVHRRDCGTRVENGVRVYPNARDLAIGDLEQTITGRSPCSYNEWVIGDYVVLGIFAAEPFYIWEEHMPEEPSDLPDYLRATSPVGQICKTDITSIEASFPALPIFSFVERQLVVRNAGRWKVVEVGGEDSAPHPYARRPSDNEAARPAIGPT